METLQEGIGITNVRYFDRKLKINTIEVKVKNPDERGRKKSQNIRKSTGGQEVPVYPAENKEEEVRRNTIEKIRNLRVEKGDAVMTLTLRPDP